MIDLPWSQLYSSNIIITTAMNYAIQATIYYELKYYTTDVDLCHGNNLLNQSPLE